MASAALPVWAQQATVDAGHSSVIFRIKHLNTSYSWGRFNDISGKLNLAGPQPSLAVEVKVDSIDTANVKRDEHLKGPDFFNAKQFPTIAFRSTSVKKVSDNVYEVDGTLNLHGVEKPLKVKLEQTGAGKNQMGAAIVGYDTSFMIKRSDFGMKFLLGGIGDDVLIFVSLECAVGK